MEIRINKFLSQSGICSRREADRLIEEKRVKIDNETALPGSKVLDNQHVYLDDKEVTLEDEAIMLAVNKPVGIVCTTTDKQGKNNIVDFLDFPKRIYPVGRLDKDSCGLILMTNDGESMNKILKSVNGHEKEYIVKVNSDIDEEFIRKMSEPIYLEELDRWTKKCSVSKVGRRTFRIVLTQGLNRQIRRMTETCGKKVVHLERVRIMNIYLGDLKPGEMRRLTDKEYKDLISKL